MIFFEEYLVVWEGRKGSGGGSRGFGFGGVGGRGTGPRDGANFATCRPGQQNGLLRGDEPRSHKVQQTASLHMHATATK